LEERKTREIALMWGKGFIYMKETDGHEKLSTYLAKYMSKAFIDERLKNQKSYVSSRNIDRPMVVRGISPKWPIVEDFLEDKEYEVVQREYETQWLGNCVHRLYKLV
jgi:hypothetical protein